MTDGTDSGPDGAAALSRDIRIGQINQRLNGWQVVEWAGGRPRITDVLRREVDRWGGVGAIYGVLRADPWSGVHWENGIPPAASVEAYGAVQEYVTTHGDGIPALFVEEAPHGLMGLGGTTLPVNLAQGAAMDPELTEDLAAVVAAEVRQRGAHVGLVSGLDVLRDPRWGRAEECFGEDPALAALLVSATVRGMQGISDDVRPGAAMIDDQHIAVVMKHFAAQGAGMGGRNGAGAPIGVRELNEVHLRPAYAAAQHGVAGFMAAYNDIDGVPCAANRELLTGMLRQKWGWDGIVMADGRGIDRLSGSAASDRAHAASLALHAGVDLSLWDDAFTCIDEAIDRGLVTDLELNQAADRVLGLKRRTGLIGTAPSAAPVARDTRSLIDRATQQSVIRLDQTDILPIAQDATVAVVGPNADDLAAQLGDYSPPRPTHDPAASTVRSAAVAQFGMQRVRFAAGSCRSTALGPHALNDVRAACADADVCVVVLGGSSQRHYADDFADNGSLIDATAETTNGEGVDLASLSLPSQQLDVVRAARSSGKRIIGVVIDGRPRPLTELRDLVDALVFAPFPGPAGGDAIVQALTRGSASGRLPATFAPGSGTLPVAHDRRLEVTRGYADVDIEDSVAFGTGHVPGVELLLDAVEPIIAVDRLAEGGTVGVRVWMTNHGVHDVSMSVPLYGRRYDPGVQPRGRQLLSVQRRTAGAGASSAITFRLGLEALGSWADGEPTAVPVTIMLWCSPDLDEPAHALPLTVV